LSRRPSRERLPREGIGRRHVAGGGHHGREDFDRRSRGEICSPWKDDPRKSTITIRHLGSHTSGLSDSTTEGVKHEEQPDWMGDFWKRLEPPRDPFTLARDKTPMLFAPGENLQYSNPGIGMMTYCVTAAIQNGEPKEIRTLLRDRVMRPLGVADGEWSIGYGKTFVVDGLPLVATWAAALLRRARRRESGASCSSKAIGKDGKF